LSLSVTVGNREQMDLELTLGCRDLICLEKAEVNREIEKCGKRRVKECFETALMKLYSQE